ncbi:hypothetical protein LCGC14_0629430 [marine sediment metagenome]|uniref:Uncharacterized protein n=1 Tax=marine sediment metagenome TaxID=412755 RepID=A0A0F9UAY2_9ZZZZ
MNKSKQFLLNEYLHGEWFRLDDIISKIAWDECPPLNCGVLCEHTGRCAVRNMVDYHWGRYVVRN